MTLVYYKSGGINVSASARANGQTKSNVFSRIALGFTLEEALSFKGRPQDGSKKHPLYSTWDGMKARCCRSTATGFKDYGGRGIKVCDKWLQDFWSFVEDMGERPTGYTLDRIDNDGDYCPANCRWVDWHTQRRNTRGNVEIPTPDGPMVRSAALQKWGRKSSTYGNRIIRGWEPIRALIEPVHSSSL